MFKFTALPLKIYLQKLHNFHDQFTYQSHICATHGVYNWSLDMQKDLSQPESILQFIMTAEMETFASTASSQDLNCFYLFFKGTVDLKM